MADAPARDVPLVMLVAASASAEQCGSFSALLDGMRWPAPTSS
jgi:hypothetical protein